MTIITLTTDFGTRDGNVGVMKGVIYGIYPEATIVDLSHDIEPQNVHQAAWVLERQVFYFPDDTVHVVVVDPGVGTARRPIATRVGPQRLVGPDNGVFTPLYDRAKREGWPLEVVHTDKPQFWLPKISHVFHGRDIFAPVGAHLASGVPLTNLGPLIDDPVRIPWPRPQRTENGFTGQVMHIDRFGNLLTNIHQDDLEGAKVAQVSLCGEMIDGMVQAFGERERGELIVLFSSTGYLFAAVVNGSASARLHAHVGDLVSVLLRA